MHEARRSGLGYYISHEYGGLRLILYAYCRVVGTVGIAERTLTFPDPAREVVRNVHPGRAVYLCWKDCRRDNPPAEPTEFFRE